jgi:F-type H+-transporting ATPase subunit b
MLVDWFTVAAQAVNFLILVWLLKRFLYKPVLAIIDAREKKVSAQLADAAIREAQARTERDDFKHRTEALDRERADLLRKATADATAERQRLLEMARQDSQALHAKLLQAMAAQRADLSRQLLLLTQTEVFSAARQVLTDLAGASLEERMAEVFILRLADLSREQRALLDTSSQHSAAGIEPRAATVRSAFNLSSILQARIQSAVRECMGAQMQIGFEISTDIINGIELRIDGHKIAWSVGDYLASLTRNLESTLEPATTPSGQAGLQHAL